ncbi:MAG: glycosyltransferase [bacterium]
MKAIRAGVVIPSRNEGDWLRRTAESVRDTVPPSWDIWHVDDASERPEPDLSDLNVRECPQPRRIGAARARAVGIYNALQDPSVQGAVTCDSHMLFGAGEALGALIEENQRFVTHKALPKDYTPPMWEAQVHVAEDKLLRLMQVAVEHDCFAYLSPCRQGPATLNVENGLYRARYTLARGPMPAELPTAAFNGGCYAGSRNAWESIGGYPQLPGHFGFEEEILSLLAAAHQIPIVCLTQISPWHLFRSQGTDPIPCPYSTSEDRELDNLAAVYRLAFPEDMWQLRWRNTLAKNILPGRVRPVPEYILREVEKPEFTAYRNMVQEGFALRGDALIAELDAKRAADHAFLEARAKG